jgi:hypothetical protein
MHFSLHCWAKPLVDIMKKYFFWLSGGIFLDAIEPQGM